MSLSVIDRCVLAIVLHRGSAYDSLGQFELAVADYGHALELDSGRGQTPAPEKSRAALGSTAA
jgi:lipoprotein NlpI